MDFTYLILLLATMVFSVWASIRVNTTFEKYSRVRPVSGITGAEAARRVLDANGLYNVRIERIHGNLTDHFDPRSNVIRLSDSVYGSSSASAIGVAAHEAGHAVGEFFKGVCSLGQILLNRHVTDDRAGNQLRKQCHVGSQVNEVLLGSSLAAIHVDGVAHGLEGVEADTDGQRQTEQRDGRAENVVYVVNKEIGILKESERADAGDDRRPKEYLGPDGALEFSDQKTVNVAGERGCQHEQRVDRLAVEVEEQAGEQKHQVLDLEGNQEVDDQNDRQKIIQEVNT